MHGLDIDPCREHDYMDMENTRVKRKKACDTMDRPGDVQQNKRYYYMARVRTERTFSGSLINRCPIASTVRETEVIYEGSWVAHA